MDEFRFPYASFKIEKKSLDQTMALEISISLDFSWLELNL